jgi:hypothetical protein
VQRRRIFAKFTGATRAIECNAPLRAKKVANIGWNYSWQ